MQDIFIAVMGATGVGKSTFIRRCVGDHVVVSDGLKSCTQEVMVYPFQYNDLYTVHLVDTPGFDDTSRSDYEVLKQIAEWLRVTYQQNVMLSGIIYLHRITENRMTGTSQRNITVFTKLCGPDCCKSVIMATSWWEQLCLPDDIQHAVDREATLMGTDEYWGWMVKRGTQVLRHFNTTESALDLIARFVPAGDVPRRPDRVVLKVQSEMVDNEISLGKTSAMEQVTPDPNYGHEKEKTEAELAEMRAKLKVMTGTKAYSHSEVLEMRQARNELEGKLEMASGDQREMEATLNRVQAEMAKQIEMKGVQAKEAAMMRADELKAVHESFQACNCNACQQDAAARQQQAIQQQAREQQARQEEADGCCCTMM